MGKIANALGKHAQERKAEHLPALNRADRAALLSYNPKTGHLLNPEPVAGKPGNHSMEALKSRGTIQRLLDHKLIFPGGKLTPKGLAECERLNRLNRVRKSGVDADIKTKEKILKDIDSDNVIIDLEEEIQPVAESAGKTDPPPEKVTVFESGRQATMTAEDKRTAILPDIPEKSHGKPVSEDLPPTAVPKVLSGEKMLHKNLVSLIDPQSYGAEQFKILRNNILFPVAGKTPQSILITSSMQGEGKSFVSANLAVSIAMNINKHVLLIDCDLRKPDLHRIFGLGEQEGLSDFLAGRRKLATLLQRTNVEKLSLLPGGPIPPNPSELASSERMAEMLEEVKLRYSDRLIVIDSPPPGLAAESSFLARQVDGIVLVVEYGKTPREHVEDLMSVVGSDKILGVVINHLDFHVSKRYGYGRYGRYGTYGYGRK